MKRVLKMTTIILMYVLFSNNVFAQVSSLTKGKSGKYLYSKVMIRRTPVYSPMKADTVCMLEIEYPKVARNFEFNFEGATNQLWIRENGVLYVSFIKNENKTSAVFTPDGNMNYAIANLHVSDMPSQVLEKIKSGYPSCSIFNIREILTNSISVYEVILQDIRQFIVLSVSQDEMAEVKKVTKS